MPVNNDYNIKVSAPRCAEIRQNSYNICPSTSNRFERTPVSDEVAVKKRESLSFKDLLINSLKQSLKKQELRRLTDKYADLISNLPEVQKTFKDVFMRDDLTEKDTLEMLKEYHKTELIRINGTPEEYANALFEVALKNYGLEDSGIQLRFHPYTGSKAGGGWHAHINTVFCKSNKSAEDYFSTIHHELRHAKQTQAVVENLSDKEYEDYFKKMCYRCAKDDEHLKHIKSYEEFEQKVLTPDFLEITMKASKGLARKNPPTNEKTLEFAKKMLEAEKNYVDADKDMEKYWNADNEKDARDAELKMIKLFGLLKSQIDFYKRMDKQYLKN